MSALIWLKARWELEGKEVRIAVCARGDAADCCMPFDRGTAESAEYRALLSDVAGRAACSLELSSLAGLFPKPVPAACVAAARADGDV